MSREPPMNIIARVSLLSLQRALTRSCPPLPSPSSLLGARNDMADGVAPQDATRKRARLDEGSAHAPPSVKRQTGMPRRRALSARFSVMPEPGKTMTPAGMTDSSWSLRRNGAALA